MDLGRLEQRSTETHRLARFELCDVRQAVPALAGGDRLPGEPEVPLGSSRFRA